MRNDLVVAVLGAGRLVGREIVAVLEERQFPFAEIRLLDVEDVLAEASHDDEHPLHLLTEAALEGCHVAFTCLPEELSAQWAFCCAAREIAVIDLSQVFAEDPAVPAIVPEVNAEAARRIGKRKLITSPVAGAVALSVVLRPIHEAGTLRRVVVAAYESVCAAAQAGIDELSLQTAQLLNGRSVDAVLFPHRIAFNVIPQVGMFLDGGITLGERLLELQTRRVLDMPDLAIAASSALVPAFYGQGYAVNVETEQPLDATAARALLRAAPGILLIDDPAENAYPTFSDVIEQAATYVGRVREDPSVPNGLSLWVAIDGVRKGAAVNAVEIAEVLLREHL